MNSVLPLLVALIWAIPVSAQSTIKPEGARTDSAVNQPRGAVPSPNPDELMSYRFRLGEADVSFALVVTNDTDQAGHFLIFGVTPESQSKTRALQPVQLDPGQTRTLPADALKWTEFQWVYCEASRRVQLRLVRDSEPDGLRIPNMRPETVYDIVSEQRLGEVGPSDSSREMHLLGAGLSVGSVLGIREDPRIGATRVPEVARRTASPKIYIIGPGNPQP